MGVTAKTATPSTCPPSTTTNGPALGPPVRPAPSVTSLTIQLVPDRHLKQTQQSSTLPSPSGLSVIQLPVVLITLHLTTSLGRLLQVQVLQQRTISGSPSPERPGPRSSS